MLNMNIDNEFFACGRYFSCSLKFVAVPGRTGVAPEFEVFEGEQRLKDRRVVVTSEEVDDDFPFPSLISRTFPDGRAAAAWFRHSGHKIPADVLRALRANDLKLLHDSQNRMTVGQRLKWFVALVRCRSIVKSFLRGLLAFRSSTVPKDAWLDDLWAYLNGRDFAHRVTFRLFERVAG